MVSYVSVVIYILRNQRGFIQKRRTIHPPSLLPQTTTTAVQTSHPWTAASDFEFDTVSAMWICVCTVGIWATAKAVYLVCISLVVKSERDTSDIERVYPFWYAFMLCSRFVCKRIARVVDSINATQRRRRLYGCRSRQASPSSAAAANFGSMSSSSLTSHWASVCSDDEAEQHQTLPLTTLHSNGLISFELCVDFVISMFYYVFYRNLFLRVDSVRVFVYFKTIHVCGEVLVFCTRLSHPYFEYSNAWLDRTWLRKCVLTRWMVTLMEDPSPYYVWCTRVSIDHSLRLMSSVVSSLGFIIGALWTRFGYNSEFYSYKNVSSAQFHRALLFVAIGVSIEMVVERALKAWVTQGLKSDFSRHWRLLVRHKPVYALYFILIGQHVLTDVFVAKIEWSDVDDTSDDGGGSGGAD